METWISVLSCASNTKLLEQVQSIKMNMSYRNAILLKCRKSTYNTVDWNKNVKFYGNESVCKKYIKIFVLWIIYSLINFMYREIFHIVYVS